MKKLIIGFLILALISSVLSIPAFAQTTNEPIQLVQSPAPIDETLTQEFLTAASRPPKSRSITTLGVQLVRQNVGAWTSDKMQSLNLSIGDYGCTLTSAVMIAKYYGYSYTPRTLNNALGVNACLLNYTVAASKMGKTCKGLGFSSLSSAKSVIVGSINSQVPVMVGLTGGYYGTHYVVAYGYSLGANTIIYIRDPMGTYMSLDSYINDGYSVNELVVFK